MSRIRFTALSISGLMIGIVFYWNRYISNTETEIHLSNATCLPNHVGVIECFQLGESTFFQQRGIIGIGPAKTSSTFVSEFLGSHPLIQLGNATLGGARMLQDGVENSLCR
jgi:hypothetical protein